MFLATPLLYMTALILCSMILYKLMNPEMGILHHKFCNPMVKGGTFLSDINLCIAPDQWDMWSWSLETC